MSKGQVGFPGAQRAQGGRGGLRTQRTSFFKKTRRGTRGLQQRKVPPIRQEGNLPRFGKLDPRHPANLEFRRTFQSASQFLRKFSKFHRGAPQFFMGLSASLAQAKEGSTSGSIATP